MLGWEQSILHHNSSLSVSILSLARVTRDHAGNYTCQPSNTKISANTHLQVETDYNNIDYNSLKQNNFYERAKWL